MQLASYLQRIGYDRDAAATFECLSAIHRAHAFAIPYENLDVQLDRPLDFDLKRIFEKLVRRSRGGWCYETHILLEWALREIGFEVKLVTAGIHRHSLGDACLGDHTAILVELDRTYLADLGLGDGLRDPIPLAEGIHAQGPLSFRLERVDGEYWRFHNHAFAYPTSFDFRDAPADWMTIGQHNHRQQTEPSATLVANFVCQIMRPASVTCLTGRVLREKTSNGTSKRIISESEFEEILSTIFGIRDPDAASIWPKIAARHEALFGDRRADQIEYTGF